MRIYSRKSRVLDRCASLGICSLLLLFAPPALALNPSLRLTQFGHTAWSVRDGALPAVPMAIAQTRDGFLWIGTEAGLLKFDGVRFERWQPPDGTKLPSDRIYAVLGAKDGALWIGTASGLARWKDGGLVVFETRGRFGSLIEDRRGDVWAGHTRVVSGLPGLCRFSDGKFHCLEGPASLGLSTVAALHEDRDGELWFGSLDKICRWRSGNPECQPAPGSWVRSSIVGIDAIAGDHEGNLWVTATSGIWRLSSGRWTKDSGASRLGWESQTMRFDRRGAFWVGTLGGGLARFTEGRADRISRADGLSGDDVTDIFEDREGNVWVGTASGLDRFRDVKLATLTQREGLPNSEVTAVAASRSGGIWVAGGDTLSRIENDSVTASWKVGHDFPGHYLTALFEDSRGRLWFGVDDGLAWLEHGRFSRFQTKGDEAIGAVFAMAEDTEGSLWVVTAKPSRAVRIRGSEVVEVLPAHESGVGGVFAIVSDPTSGVWIASSSALHFYKEGHLDSYGKGSSFLAGVRGLFVDSRGVWLVTRTGMIRFRNGSFDTLDTSNGLPHNDIGSAESASDGSLWLKTAGGLARIGASALDAWSNNPGSRVEVRTLDVYDGVQAGLTPFTPRSAESGDGRLWFGLNEGGVQVFDPAHLEENTIPPPVEVIRVVADHKPYGPKKQIELLPRTKDVEIDYVALSLAVPEKVSFRYRLEGVDGEWQDAGTRREEFYTNLKPGPYRFQVVACNNDGVWNAEGAAVEFRIRPAFYQTRAFLAACVLAVAGFGWWGYRARVRRIRAKLDQRFEERLAERIRIARELHDTLLQGFVGASMQLHLAADQLPAESDDARRFQRALELVGRVIEDGRNAVHGLRVPFSTDDDLESAFTRAARELEVDANVSVRVIGEGRARPLSATIRDEVHRIGREALANAIHHAGATLIEVEVKFDPRHLRVLVRDDGVGIDPEVLASGRENLWGLRGMRERAASIGGSLQIWSRSGAGTEVELSVPGRIAYASGRKRGGSNVRGEADSRLERG